MANKQRKALVEKIREEGRWAAREGKSRHSNPHQYMSAMQWLRGYDEVMDTETEAERKEWLWYRALPNPEEPPMDVHAAVAMDAGLDWDKLTPDDRRRVRAANFGMLYGSDKVPHA